MRDKLTIFFSGAIFGAVSMGGLAWLLGGELLGVVGIGALFCAWATLPAVMMAD